MKIDSGLFYWLLCIIKFIMNIIDFVLNLFLGYSMQSGWKTERKYAKEHYENSAQVVNVKWRAAYAITTRYYLKNFLYTHERYTHPNIVLKNDNMTLYEINEENVVFCMTETSIDVYCLDTIAFAFINQFLFAKQLIIIPLSSMLRLGEELGDPKNRDVILIQNSSRCGSTLLCQMFNKLPNTRVQSEPWCLLSAHGLYNRGKFTKERYYDVIKNLLRLQAKKEHSRNDIRLVIKFDFLQMPLVDILQIVTPYVKQIFSTRHPMPTIASFTKVRSSHPYIFKLHPVYSFWFAHLPLPYEDQMYQKLFKKYMKYWNQRFVCTPAQSAMAYSGIMMCYIRSKEIFKALIVYENLIENPMGITKEMFQSLDIPTEHAELALTSLQKHSQHNMFDKGDIKNKKFVNEKEWKNVDEIFKEFNVPLKHDMSLDDFKRFLE